MDGEGGRTSYNIAIQMTNAQQMLLNLVRLRYGDSPLFLDVASITTQSTFRADLSPVFSIPMSSDHPFKLGTDIMWQDQPTITYTPLEGHAFAERLLRPIDLHTIQLLCYSGWDIDRVFRMTIQHFEDLSNATEATGPMPEHMPVYEKFSEASGLLRYFQKRGELQVGLKMKESHEKTEASEEVGLQITFPGDSEESSRLALLLHSELTATGKYRKEVAIGLDDNGSMGVMPRSILSCMYYLSQGVQVPKDHIDSGIVRQPTCNSGKEDEDWHSMFCELLAVRCHRFPPQNAFISVKYHHCWFYIDDCDLVSKKTFALLLQLYNLNAIVPKNRGPILSLPLR
jgi:hypothetical protein